MTNVNADAESDLNQDLIKAVAEQDVDAVDRAIHAGANVAAYDYAVLSVAANSGDLIPDPATIDPKRQAVLNRLLDEIIACPRDARAVLAWAARLDNDTIVATLRRLPLAEFTCARAYAAAGDGAQGRADPVDNGPDHSR